MSFLDKITKAVSDTVDQGKKQVDQFMRIQKVKGEISAEEQKIHDAGTRAQQVKQAIGEAVISRLGAGTLVDPELQAQADRVAAIDAEVAGFQAVIVEKKAEIARIEAEGAPPAAAPVDPPHAVPPVPAAVAGAPVVPPPLPSAAPAAVAPPPLPGAATKACPQCGAKVPVAAVFCTECGAKLS
jgi:hypothetical protein